MYQIIYDFLAYDLFRVESPLIPILTDVSMILIYVALVYMLLWVFSFVSKVFKL